MSRCEIWSKWILGIMLPTSADIKVKQTVGRKAQYLSNKQSKAGSPNRIAAWLRLLREGKTPTFELDSKRLLGPPERRVFIGGNYNLAPVLRYIQQIAAREGFLPIFLGDFKVKRSRTYFTSLALLHRCRSAIFDITLDSGHLLEVQEISKKENIELLLLYMSADHRKRCREVLQACWNCWHFLLTSASDRWGTNLLPSLKISSKNF